MVLKMKVVEEQADAEIFSLNVKRELADYLENVERVRQQYREPKTLKEHLPLNEMIIVHVVVLIKYKSPTGIKRQLRFNQL